jgi:tetratricopeptide (TPR) repeat protein
MVHRLRNVFITLQQYKMKFVFSIIIALLAFAASAQDAVSYYNSAIDKFEEGNVLGAIKDFDSAIVKNSKMAEAYWGRGSVYAEMQEFDGALKDLNKCIEIDPSVVDAFYNRAYVLMAMGEQQKALNDLNMYCLMKPEDINGYLSRLDILVKNSMHDEAFKNMETIAVLEASTPGEYVQRARVKFLMKDTVGSILDLNAGINLAPTFMEAYFLRGKYNYEFGFYNKAIQDLSVYLLSNKEDHEAFVIRGECFARQSDFSLAAKDYTKAIALEKNNSTYYFDRGFFYIQLEEYASAQKDFKMAIYFNHSDIRLAYFNLGIAEYRLGNKENACTNWRKSEDLGMDYINKYCL